MVKQRSYESIKNLSPKRRVYEMDKLSTRIRDVRKTAKLLFESNLLTLDLFQNLELINIKLVNEHYKIKHFDTQFVKGDKKDKIIVYSFLHIQFSKEFRRRFKLI